MGRETFKKDLVVGNANGYVTKFINLLQSTNWKPSKIRADIKKNIKNKN